MVEAPTPPISNYITCKHVKGRERCVINMMIIGENTGAKGPASNYTGNITV